jgi:diguanylate cyclase (GGDEF)-like protein
MPADRLREHHRTRPGPQQGYRRGGHDPAAPQRAAARAAGCGHLRLPGRSPVAGPRVDLQSVAAAADLYTITQPVADAFPDAGADAHAATDPGPDADAQGDAEPGADADADPDAHAQADAGPDAEPGADADAHPDAGALTHPGADADAQADPVPDADAGADGHAGPDPDAGTDPDAQADSDPEADAAAHPDHRRHPLIVRNANVPSPLTRFAAVIVFLAGAFVANPQAAGASPAGERAVPARTPLAPAAYWDASGSRALSGVLDAPFGSRLTPENPRSQRPGAALWLRFSAQIAEDAYLVVHGYDGSGTLYARRSDGSALATPFYAGGTGGTLRTGPERIVLHPSRPARQTYYLRLTPADARPISLALVPAPALANEESVRADLIVMPNILMIGAILAVALGSALLAVILLDGSYALFAGVILLFLLADVADIGVAARWLWPQGGVTPELIGFVGRSGYGILLLVLCKSLRDKSLVSRIVYWLSIAMFGALLVGGELYVLWPSVVIGSGLYAGLDPALTAGYLICAVASISIGRQLSGPMAMAQALAFTGAIVGITMGRAGANGLVHESALTIAAPALGMMWQVVILFSALAYRIRLAEGVASSLVDERDELEDAALRDMLTGIPNRRAYEGRLAQEWRKASRTDTALAMILIDVDFFKTYNDTFGHPIGDEALAAVARAIAMSLRGKEDFVARYGGEEFVIILPDCGSQDALQIAERVREEIRCLGIIHPGSPLGVLTISAGVASLSPRRTRRARSLTEASDAALYIAKRSGRDRVSVSGAISIGVPEESPIG